MDTNADFQSDLVERRRLQNRLAQRKFREKKRRAAGNSLLSTTQSPNGSVQAQSAPQAAAVSGDRVMDVTTMLPSLEGFDERELAVTSFEFSTMELPTDQETHDITFYSPDVVTFQPDLVPSGPEEETTRWDPALLDILSSSLTHGNDDILESTCNEKQNEGTSLQRRTSNSELIPSTSAHDLLPSHHNDDSLVGLITFSKQEGWMAALHIAAQRGHEQILRVLLQRDNMDVNQQDSDGRTPLLHAVMQNHEPVVRLLLTQGAQIEILDCDGRSGIHWAVLRRNLSILQLLLKHRDEYEPMLAIDMYDNTGWTPLHMAIVRAFEPAMLLLMQLGADINSKAHKCPFQKK